MSKYWRFNAGDESVGWLGTGDMNLNRKRRRDSFINFYDRAGFLDMVDVFQLPHHGSARDIDCSIFNNMQRLRICFAAAGPNSYGHPGKSVIQSVLSTGHFFHQVSHEGSTTLRMTFSN